MKYVTWLEIIAYNSKNPNLKTLENVICEIKVTNNSTSHEIILECLCKLEFVKKIVIDEIEDFDK